MVRASIVALLIVAVVLTSTAGTRADPEFDPSLELTLAQPEPQAPSEFTFHFGIHSGRQFAAMVLYLPRDWGVARGELIPIGTKLATVNSTETFGFINGACNSAIPIEFELFNSTLDSTQTVSFLSRYDEWLPDYAEDEDGNGLLDAIDHYPDFLNDAFGDARPIARLAGVTHVAGVPLLVQFLVLAPGTHLSLPDRTLAQSIADVPESGYPMVVVLQDFRGAEGRNQPGPITDYCPPRETTASFSPPDSGPALLVNPQSGSYGFTFTSLSERDADNDGVQNSLDVCQFVANVGDATFIGDGDLDTDGMDIACDEDDGITNHDVDGDGYVNRQDNCPLEPTAQFADWADAPSDWSGVQSDADFDDIGDACDPNPNTPDGHVIVSKLTAGVVVGDASGAGGPPSTAACPQCYRPDSPLPETDAGTNSAQLAVAAGLIALGGGASAIVVGGGAVYLLRRRRS